MKIDLAEIRLVEGQHLLYYKGIKIPNVINTIVEQTSQQEGYAIATIILNVKLPKESEYEKNK